MSLTADLSLFRFTSFFSYSFLRHLLSVFVIAPLRGIRSPNGCVHASLWRQMQYFRLRGQFVLNTARRGQICMAGSTRDEVLTHTFTPTQVESFTTSRSADVTAWYSGSQFFFSSCTLLPPRWHPYSPSSPPLPQTYICWADELYLSLFCLTPP